MNTQASLIATLALMLAGACATAPSSRAATPASDVSTAVGAGADARCAAVADSVRAATLPADLPVAAPRARPRLPIPRGMPGGDIQTTFLVDPTGRVVPGSVVTTGGDQEYRGRMEDVVMRTMFRPPIVAGCPSWGRGDFRLRTGIG